MSQGRVGTPPSAQDDLLSGCVSPSAGFPFYPVGMTGSTPSVLPATRAHGSQTAAQTGPQAALLQAVAGYPTPWHPVPQACVLIPEPAPELDSVVLRATP